MVVTAYLTHSSEEELTQRMGLNCGLHFVLAFSFSTQLYSDIHSQLIGSDPMTFGKDPMRISPVVSQVTECDENSRRLYDYRCCRVAVDEVAG